MEISFSNDNNSVNEGETPEKISRLSSGITPNKYGDMGLIMSAKKAITPGKVKIYD